MIYDYFKLEISVLALQDCCHFLIIVQTHSVYSEDLPRGHMHWKLGDNEEIHRN